VVDVAQHRLEADIVIRKGIFFQPKTYFGRPRQQVAFLQEFGPEEQDLISRLLARVSIGQNTDYPGLPAPEASTLAAGPVTVNDLLLYWIHHGRVRVVPGISRFEGTTVHFSNGTSRDYDSIVWATGFNVRLPFLDDELIAWRDKVPVRYAGGILPEGAEKLYFVGLIAPRGPQIPIYGVQAKIVARMIALHEAAGPGGLALSTYFAELQEPETRIDVVRHLWLDQLADTERMLAALEVAARHQRLSAPERPTITASALVPAYRRLRSRRCQSTPPARPAGGCTARASLSRALPAARVPRTPNGSQPKARTSWRATFSTLKVKPPRTGCSRRDWRWSISTLTSRHRTIGLTPSIVPGRPPGDWTC
jgi:Flavin-binding monooxygenase-like